MKVHVDINVFMDVLTKRAGWLESFSTIDSIRPPRIVGYISALTPAIVQFLRVKKVGEMPARAEAQKMTQDFEIVPLTRQIILDAFELPLPEFEDNIQFLSAKEMKVDYIITHNKKHFAQNEISVLTPREFLQRIGILK